MTSVGRRVAAVSVVLTATLLGVGCSDDHPRPITAPAKDTALAEMSAISPPPGFVRESDPCADGYICFHSASGAAMTAAGYKRVSGAFGVKLTDAQCDSMPTANDGRTIQNCTAFGRYGRWGVAALLTVRRSDASHAETDVDYAPTRDFG